MGRSMTAEAALLAFGDIAGSTSTEALEKFKYERLLELRAVIDTLRIERDDELLRDAMASRNLHPL